MTHFLKFFTGLLVTIQVMEVLSTSSKQIHKQVNMCVFFHQYKRSNKKQEYNASTKSHAFLVSTLQPWYKRFTCHSLVVQFKRTRLACVRHTYKINTETFKVSFTWHIYGSTPAHMNCISSYPFCKVWQFPALMDHLDLVHQTSNRWIIKLLQQSKLVTIAFVKCPNIYCRYCLYSDDKYGL